MRRNEGDGASPSKRIIIGPPSLKEPISSIYSPQEVTVTASSKSSMQEASTKELPLDGSVTSNEVCTIPITEATNLLKFPSLDSDVVVPPTSNLQGGPASFKSILQKAEASVFHSDVSTTTNEVCTTTSITGATNFPKVPPMDADRKVHPTSSLQEEPVSFKSSLQEAEVLDFHADGFTTTNEVCTTTTITEATNLHKQPPLDPDTKVHPTFSIQEEPAFSKSSLQEAEALDLQGDGSTTSNEACYKTTITKATIICLQ